ncbi:hypothetical protein P9112_002596 [Eukaryota sp. TZLM1-RC]
MFIDNTYRSRLHFECSPFFKKELHDAKVGEWSLVVWLPFLLFAFEFHFVTSFLLLLTPYFSTIYATISNCLANNWHNYSQTLLLSFLMCSIFPHKLFLMRMLYCAPSNITFIKIMLLANAPSPVSNLIIKQVKKSPNKLLKPHSVSHSSTT